MRPLSILWAAALLLAGWSTGPDADRPQITVVTRRGIRGFRCSA
jgi:hypothetical protein